MCESAKNLLYHERWLISWLWGLTTIFVISCSSDRSAGPAAPSQKKPVGSTSNAPPTANKPAPGTPQTAVPGPHVPAAGTGPASANATPAGAKPAEQSIVHLPDLPGDRDAVVLFPDGTRAATCGEEGKVQVYQLPATVVTAFDGIPGTPRLAVSDDGKWLAQASDRDDRIKIWNVETKQEFKTLEGQQLPVADLAFAPGGSKLASAGQVTEPGAVAEIKIWNLMDGGEPTTLPATSSVTCVAFSPDGKYLASAGTARPAEGTQAGGGTVSGALGETLVWDLETRQVKTRVVSERGNAHQVVFAPDGNTLAIAERDGPNPLHVADRVRLVAPLTGQQLGILVGHMGPIFGLAYSPDGQFLMTAGQDRLLRVWQVPTRSLRSILYLDGYERGKVTFSRDGACWATAARRDGASIHPLVATLEQALQGEASMPGAKPFPVRVLEDDTETQIHRLALSPDGAVLAASSRPLGIMLYDTSSWRTRRIPEDGGIYAAAFSPDLRQALVAKRTLRLWGLKEARELRDLGDPVRSGSDPALLVVAYAPDGNHLASSHVHPDREGIIASATIRLRDLQTGQWLAVASYPEGQAGSLAYSADGKRIAAACRLAKLTQSRLKWKGPVSVWDTAEPEDPQAWRMQSLRKTIQREVPDAVQAVFRKADTYYREGKREEILAKTLQPVVSQLAEITPSPDPLDLHWQQITLNTQGAGIDAVRFRIPAGEPVDLMWTAVLTQDFLDCRVIPATGPLPDAQERFVYSQTVSVSSYTYEEALGRMLEHPAIQPGQEYILWFAIRGDTPVNVRFSVNLVPKGKLREKGWGLPVAGDPELAKVPLLRRRGLFYHGGNVIHVALSPDGRRVASVGEDDLVKVWDVESGELAASFSGHVAEFSPDGNLLATTGVGQEAASVILWDVTTGNKLRTLTGGHFLGVNALAFSRDSQRLASGGRDGWVTLWNPQTGEQVPAP